jgi:hypothetical protein
MATSGFHHVIEQTNRALDEFIRGNPEPMKQRFSHHDDDGPANPVGPAVRGWQQVGSVMARAAAHHREGEAPMRTW